MVKYIVFDFDGTLVDSKNVFISAFNQLAEKHRFEKILPGNIDHLRTLSLRERCRVLRVPLYKIPLLTTEFLGLYRKRIHEITLMDGMLPVLKGLRDSGFKLAVVSSNAENIIQDFLDRNGIDQFESIYSYNRIFGKDRIIRKFLTRNKLRSEEMVYVGDEERDIIACKKNNVKIIWVSWGFDVYGTVEKDGPDFIAQQPADILEVINRFPVN